MFPYTAQCLDFVLHVMRQLTDAYGKNFPHFLDESGPVRHPCLYADADSHGPDVQNTIEIPQFVLTQWPTSLLCGSCWFSGASVEKTFVLSCRLCRGAEVVSHGPSCSADHRDSQVAVH